MFKFVFALLFVLAGRALAFNVTLGKQVFQAGDILNITQQDVPNQCTGNFTTARDSIDGCNGDPTCLCQANVVQNLRAAQQCMFEQLVAENVRPADVRVGSNVLMSSYSTSCTSDANINLTASQFALTVPKEWDGPFVAILPVGGTAITVIAGGLLGFAALMLLSNIE